MSARTNERVAFLAGGKLDRALTRHIAQPDRLRLGGDRSIVDARAAALDEASRLAVRSGEPALRDQLEGGHAALEQGAGHLDGGERRARATLRENAARRLGGGLGRGAAVAQRGRLG